jgi:hypothetical protein
MVDALTELRSLRERWVRKGQRVLLPADKAEGTLMEVGKIVSYDDASETFVVQVEREVPSRARRRWSARSDARPDAPQEATIGRNAGPSPASARYAGTDETKKEIIMTTNLLALVIFLTAAACTVPVQTAPAACAVSTEPGPGTFYLRPEIGSGACAFGVDPNADWALSLGPKDSDVFLDMGDSSSPPSCAWACENGNASVACGEMFLNLEPGGKATITSKAGTCTTAWSLGRF